MSKEPLDLREPYFNTLRDEIKATKARIFTLLLAGLVGSPILTYFVVNSSSYIFKLVAPLLVLLVLVLYLSEQTMLMRAAQYIRKHVESDDADWERWVGSFKLRSAERQLFGMFIIVGLFLFTILTMIAMKELKTIEYNRFSAFSYEYFFWKYGVMAFYCIATVWALGTLARFWHAATSTDE